MPDYKHITIPEGGANIAIDDDGNPAVPDNPYVCFIEGDGIGPDITRAMLHVVNSAVEKSYGGDRKIHWVEVFSGEKANDVYGEYMPEETFEAIRHFFVCIKGPLTTPVGGGFRSLNVTLRKVLDLYACVRPVRYFEGVPSPVKNPEHMDMVIFRENTEDVYSGIEWVADSDDCKKVISFLNDEMGCSIREGSGIGIKPISSFCTKRLVRKAMQYATRNKKGSVTLVHKGNIMKFTEGAFRDWGYELALEEFRDQTLTEDELWDQVQDEVGNITVEKGKFADLRGGADAGDPGDRVVIKDRIADNMLQQLLTRTRDYDVLALPNLNGDYLSDAAAGQVGGLGIAPGANIGDKIALFEPTHGTAPKYAGQDKVNPSSLILSAVMMLEHMGWTEAKDMIDSALGKTYKEKTVTYDFARQMDGATKVKCSEFAEAVVQNMA